MTGTAAAWPKNARRFVAPAVLVFAANAAGSIFLGAGAEGSVVSNVLQVVAALIAALASLEASRRSTGLARRFWTLAAMAFGIWSAAQVSYVYHENWQGVAVPQPSWTHFLFRLYGAPLLMALLLVHDDDSPRGLDWQQVLDFAQVGILFLLFYFDLYFAPGREWQGLTSLRLWGFFDLSDVENWSLLGAFLARAQLSRRVEERALSRRLVPYLLSYAAASTFYNYAYWFWGARTGEWTDLVFTFSLALATILIATWKERAVGIEPGASPAILVNWAPALVPLFVLALALPMARHDLTVAFVSVFGSVACFGGRLIITLYRRRRLMEALQASEARYANLLHLAPDAIFVHRGGRVTFANPASARTLGLSSTENLVGRHILDFAPPELRAGMGERIQDGDPAAKPWIARGPDGRAIHLDAVGMVIEPGTADSPPTRLVIARDVTERHRAEAEREALIHALEAKNAELERFTYTVSHDLRSPLITISLFLSHVEESAARGDLAALHDDVERIRRAAARMDHLLKDLLQLSRIGHVMGPSEPIPFDGLCLDAISLVEGRLAAKGVAVDIDPGLPIVQGDRVRLIEVMQNLLDNAAKFMGDQKDPRIRIGARREAGRETVFFIEDNGMGIDPNHHDRVFGLFDRLEAQGEGTGVGLALVKRIVELHGGRIWVESEGGGKGTRFCFTLSRGAGEDAAPAGRP